MFGPCECSDPGCPEHKGKSRCSYTGEVMLLYRIDMEDKTGSAMCEKCASDAFESGVFTDSIDDEEEIGD